MWIKGWSQKGRSEDRSMMKSMGRNTSIPLFIPSVSWPQVCVSKERIVIPVPNHLMSHHPRCIFSQALFPAHLDRTIKERIFCSFLSKTSCTWRHSCVKHTHRNTHIHIIVLLGWYFSNTLISQSNSFRVNNTIHGIMWINLRNIHWRQFWFTTQRFYKASKVDMSKVRPTGQSRPKREFYVALYFCLKSFLETSMNRINKSC